MYSVSTGFLLIIKKSFIVNIKILIIIALMTFSMVAVACTGNSNIEVSTSKITVSDTSISYAQNEDRRIITTFGVIKNATETCVADIVVEVTYFDSQNKLVDVITAPLYDIVIAPSQEVAFRVRDVADKPKESYTSSTVRVISAEPRISKQSSEKEGFSWLQLFFSFVPMLLLIGIWLLVMRKYHGNKSPQQRTLEAQLTTLTRQVEVLERLATATEKLAENK
jgi:ATP-dependent Zn protease